MRWVLVERLRPFVRVAHAATCVLNLALLIPAIYLLQVFDRVFATGDRRALVFLTAVALLATLAGYAADRLRTGALLSAARMFDRELVPAAITTSLDTLRDTRLLRASLSQPGVLALFDLPWSLLCLGVIVLLHPLLGITALTGIALLIVAVAVTAGLQNFERGDSLLRAARLADDQADDLVRNNETLAAMGMSQTAVATWRERHERLLSRGQRSERGVARLGAIVRAGSIALQIVILALGSWLATGSRLSVASLIAAALLLARALRPFEQVIDHLPALIATRCAWLRLNKPSSSVIVAGSITTIVSGWVDLDRVSYSPSAGRPATIRNVSLALAPGESLLIFGPSGCGKTTLARLLLGVLEPRSGSIRVDGPEGVGYVAQDVQLFSGSIADNIARLGTMNSTRVVQAARLARAHELIVRMPAGYHTEVGEAGARLAAGQRWRVALARALYLSPRLLVLDEPDTDVVETLAELKARGTTVIILARRTSLAEHVDRMAILREGTLHVLDRAAVRSGAWTPESICHPGLHSPPHAPA